MLQHEVHTYICEEVLLVTSLKPVIIYKESSLFLLWSAGILIEEKNWPPFFPIIHHDIAKEIPIHLQRLQCFAFASLLGISLLEELLPLLHYFNP